ncbi:cysteine desulfurase family protein [Novosphingobium tardum]|uniref:Cysteine desulfurase n=1 Tax=Novosphingobium tardum TaxID=1538021 RepID=A0ABV8RPS5_9SPHN
MLPPLYLDHAATAPLLPEARAALEEGFAHWANPSSPHRAGRAARAALELARERICAALEWDGALIFTSGATEALALALGTAKAGNILVSAVEHEAVQRPAGSEASVIPVGRDGLVDLTALDRMLAEAGQRPLVAVQQVGNETGVIQLLDEVAALVTRHGGMLLADCAQGGGKLALPPADLIALSAHKFGGPIGTGALLVRDFALLNARGGQERGYRAGTENLPGAMGMAAAIEAGDEWLAGVESLRAVLEQRIVEEGGEVIAQSSPRLATIGAYRMPNVMAASQLIRFDAAGIAVSAGSACSSGSLRTSHVLAAMNLDAREAGEVIRVSLGRETTMADVARFGDAWAAISRAVRAAA